MSDIFWRNVTVALGDLKPWERNPKSISKTHAKRLLASWDKFGQFQTVAIGPGFEVYDGHQRLSVLRAAYGDGYSVDARQSSRELTDSERRELVIAAHVGTTGQFNWDELANWDAAELQEWGLDSETLQDWKTGIGALTELIEAAKEEPPEDPGAQIDKADELREKWGVETGQLWQLGEHQVLCGDASVTTQVKQLDTDNVAVILTDPPYSSGGFQEAQRKSGSIGTRQNIQIASDQLSTRGYLSLMSEVLAIVQTDCLYMFTDWRMWCWTYDIAERANYPVRSMLVWDKGKMGMGFPWRSTHELILFAKRTPSKMMDGKTGNVLRFDRVPNENHPTEKPVEIFAHILGNTPDGDVYDPFLGSGTTLIACEQTGRKCRAVEISPAYVAVAIQRWVDMTGGTPELITNV